MSKIALITGGTSGIGYETARLLTQKGYQVYIGGQSTDRVNTAAKQLNALPFVLDLQDTDAMAKSVEIFLETGLDILVNNAGIAKPIPLSDYTVNAINQHFDINITAPIMLLHHLLPALEKKRGSICNVSSVITRRGSANFALYAASKGALEAFTKNLAIELAPKNIRINAICPGAVDTPIFSKMGIPEDHLPAVKAAIIQTIPLQRFATPAEVAKVIVDQLEATYVTGSVWTVDGGVAC